MNDALLKADAETIERDIESLAAMVDSSKPGWTRRPFTPWYEQGRQWLRERMVEIGMHVEIDAASNLIGRLPGSDPSLKPIMVGSHTDTVTGGGRFDGIIGVLAGLEIVRTLKRAGIVLRHPLMVVDFTAEEPSEFGISTIGSRGMVGNLPEEMLERTDPSGLVLRDAIRLAGGDPDALPSAALGPGDIALYLELHIEQGPVLEQTGTKLGVVTGIVGIHRYRVTVEGRPNHAGTTPMTMRSDALTGAARMILELEAICREHDAEPVVGTIGKLTVEPNASNVIPGRVVFDLEVRSLSVDIMEELICAFKRRTEEIALNCGIAISMDCLSKSEPIRVDEDVQAIIRSGCAATASSISLPSGAGHDANQIARIAPIGMVFVPSKDGRSHCPEEWTDYADVALGVEALTRTIVLYDNLRMKNE
ncbi:Zn-dependent hydrolase [Paenibacillus naphthalenovorans]|uniref:Zn-dependent hydrolase n=1 Tax=Paenibacillus naphthalenovorans TaxID=162209 RepID=UPI0010AFE691|nr:Zn-dependent hydrolase [Paenibacillus naphthalenovorans]GCL73327.1 Zn-dependent hydrolase [Paenibacillus naphthalenovorans]